jgi:RIO kinase 1
VHREWETLQLLSEADVSVPRPIEATERAILMSYVGDEDQPAPQLHRFRPSSAEETEDLLELCLAAVEQMLFVDVVHGDLSPYNLLVWDGRVVVIDLPQAVDTKKNRHAEDLLGRDVRRVCEHFARLGVVRDSSAITRDLWTAWTFADLIPRELRGKFEVEADTV